jgi:hypothetical protein
MVGINVADVPILETARNASWRGRPQKHHPGGDFDSVPTLRIRTAQALQIRQKAQQQSVGEGYRFFQHQTPINLINAKSAICV